MVAVGVGRCMRHGKQCCQVQHVRRSQEDSRRRPGRMFFSNRSVKQREDILTNKLAVNTHVIVRKTQIAQCATVNNWGDTWNIIRWWAIMF